MNDLLKLLDGKKTYITAIAGILATLAMKYGYIRVDQYYDVAMMLAFGLAIFLRMAFDKVAPGADIIVPTPTKEDIPQPAQPDISQLIVALQDLVADKEAKK